MTRVSELMSDKPSTQTQIADEQVVCTVEKQQQRGMETICR